jgi:5-methylthioadenosine/S-adenosylhomocysteine deaminase
MFYHVANSSGYRMTELNRRGVPMGFGTDVAKSWGFGEGPFVAYLLARDTGDYLSAEQLLEMMTLGGARAVGLAERIGSLEPGKRADLVVRRADLPESQPGFDPVHDIMLVSRSRSVDSVICNGEVVLRKGRSTRLDESTLADRAITAAQRLCLAAGIEPPRRNTPRTIQ